MIHIRPRITAAILAFLFLVTFLAGCGAQNSEAPPEQTVVSDAAVLAFSNIYGSYTSGLGAGGVYSLRESLADDGADVSLISLGDICAPHDSASLLAAARILNALGCVISLPGSAECSLGEDALKEYMSRSEAEFLACNANCDGFGFKPYTVRDFGGRKTGFVGVLDPSDSDFEAAGISLLDEEKTVKAVQNAVDACKSEGAERVMLLTYYRNDDILNADWSFKDPGENASPARLEVFSNLNDHTSAALVSEIRGVDLLISSREGSCSYGLLKDADGNDVIVTSSGDRFSAISEILVTADGYCMTANIPKTFSPEKDDLMTEFAQNIMENPNSDIVPPPLSEKKTVPASDRADGDIVILFTNDMHNKYLKNIGFDGLAAFKARVTAQKPSHLLLTDSGDSYQNADRSGERTVALMNHLGYSFCTYGNNELDYKNAQVAEFSSAANAKYVCCNLKYNGEHPEDDPFAELDGYAVAECGSRRLGFVGVTTTKSVKQHQEHFLDPETGEFVYDFGQSSEEAMAEMIQENVDKCREAGADTVILLAHIGTDVSSTMAALTSGIDIILDAHSHTVIPYDTLENKNGERVFRASTGCHFENIGQLVITSGGLISTGLISAEAYTEKDPTVTAMIQEMTEGKSQE